MKLSDHFTVKEFQNSQYAERHGIDNSMNEEQLECAKALCENVLEPLRIVLDKSVHISSGFRCYDLNKGIGGSVHSQHSKGQAVDVHVTGMSCKELAEKIELLELPFDQLIYEGSWVHVSHAASNRGAVLTATFKNGKASYSKGLS